MLPQYYHKCISQLLTSRQYATLRIIVLILQSYRTIQIEKLASVLPIPIKYESRRGHIQRFLVLPQLTTKSNQYIQQEGEEYQQLISLGLKPGKSFYLKQVRFTKQTESIKRKL